MRMQGSMNNNTYSKRTDRQKNRNRIRVFILNQQKHLYVVLCTKASFLKEFWFNWGEEHQIFSPSSNHQVLNERFF